MSDFDLDSAQQLLVADYALKHPVTGAATGAVFTLAGPEHEIRRQRLFALMRARRAAFEKEGRLLTTDPADDAVDELDLLAACTLGWRGLAVKGEPLAFSADACKALFADPKRAWVRDQVKAALDQRELFIAGSANA